MKVLEKHVEHAVDGLLVPCGFRVVRFSQTRASKQTLGIPDRRYVHRQMAFAMWWEVKRPGYRQSKDQWGFEQDCVATGELYVLGGPDTAAVLLGAIGCRDASGLMRPGGWRRLELRASDAEYAIRAALDASGVQDPYRYRVDTP